MNYTTDKLALTIRQLELKINKNVYTKSLILTILIQYNASADLIHKSLVRYFGYNIALRTTYKYLNELIKCSLLCKQTSLIDSKVKIYSLKKR